MPRQIGTLTSEIDCDDCTNRRCEHHPENAPRPWDEPRLRIKSEKVICLDYEHFSADEYNADVKVSERGVD